ncbi:hypothetical protein SDC9_92475 [bioreactor metagenome]|uniref:Uncharacterized protein n=1 Tax=bioreactor metagenome TaxID=1076179 RepID=A0A645A4L5_9ZZZZ
MKKVISCILAAAMIAMAVAMTSCEEKPAVTGKNTGTAPVTGTVTGAADPDPWPTADLSGKTLKIFGREDTSWKTKPDILPETEVEDDVISSEITTRNQWLKDNYGFDIEFTGTTDADWLNTAKAELQAGTAGYNLFIGNGSNLAALSKENALVDLASHDTMNLDREWWDQCSIRDLSIAGKVFFLTGSLSTSDIDCTYALYFNKAAAEENNIENPYQLVYDNKWTLDKLLEICKDVRVDTNDDGKWTDVDNYGYLCENYDSYAMFFGSGETVVKKNAEDLPEFSLETTRAADVVEAMKNYYTADGVFVNYAATITPMFQKRQSVFCGTILMKARTVFRQMDDDFGVLPLPKYESSQENYVSAVSSGTSGSLVGIPTSCDDVDSAVLMLELFTRKSHDTLRKGYYDVVVTKQSVRDEDSVKMLDIILGSRVFDAAYIYSWGGWFTWLYNIAGNPSGANIASQISAQKDKTLTDIQDTVDAFKSFIG